MDLRQIEYFVALYDERSITKAARRDCDRVAMKVLGKQVRMFEPKAAKKAAPAKKK